VKPPCSRCGHLPKYHRDGGIAHDCEGYVDAILPAPGERLLFGVHRLPLKDRDFSMPSEASRENAYRAWVRGALREST
jgi:hypothetical protein